MLALDEHAFEVNITHAAVAAALAGMNRLHHQPDNVARKISLSRRREGPGVYANVSRYTKGKSFLYLDTYMTS